MGDESKLQKKKCLRLKLKHLSKTVECGLHSGIPDYCIKWYISKWTWMPLLKRMERVNRLKKYNIGYIPCPQCLRNKAFVKVKKCPRGTHCNHWKEQADS
jgi:hypothetical protein